ncbi:MAG: hypothetical protein AVDCRST_MAG64-2320, partial [uncultured Phycisphaerae bacterium]
AVGGAGLRRDRRRPEGRGPEQGERAAPRRPHGAAGPGEGVPPPRGRGRAVVHRADARPVVQGGRAVPVQADRAGPAVRRHPAPRRGARAAGGALRRDVLPGDGRGAVQRRRVVREAVRVRVAAAQRAGGRAARDDDCRPVRGRAEAHPPVDPRL